MSQDIVTRGSYHCWAKAYDFRFFQSRANVEYRSLVLFRSSHHLRRGKNVVGICFSYCEEVTPNKPDRVSISFSAVGLCGSNGKFFSEQLISASIQIGSLTPTWRGSRKYWIFGDNRPQNLSNWWISGVGGFNLSHTSVLWLCGKTK